MDSQEYLEHVARDFYKTKQAERLVNETVQDLRDEFFRMHDEAVKGRSYTLPVKTIEVPDEFFAVTGMSAEEFVESRFPNWNVEHVEKNTATNKTTFILKQNYRYVPGIVEIDDDDKVIRVAKEVSEYTPEIDWETLKAERPDLFDKLAQPVTRYEIDEVGFAEMVDKNPEELATLQRHMKVKPPTLRATARRVKKDE